MSQEYARLKQEYDQLTAEKSGTNFNPIGRRLSQKT